MTKKDEKKLSLAAQELEGYVASDEIQDEKILQDNASIDAVQNTQQKDSLDDNIASKIQDENAAQDNANDDVVKGAKQEEKSDVEVAKEEVFEVSTEKTADADVESIAVDDGQSQVSETPSQGDQEATADDKK
jgi:hypothetical protein